MFSNEKNNKYEGLKILIIVYFLLLIPVLMEYISSEVAIFILMASQSIPLFKATYKAYNEKNKISIITNLLNTIFIIVLSSTCLILK